MFTWPPQYTIKRHPRAKYVKLKASQKHGLELVVPTRFSLKNIPAVLLENRTWIEKQLLKLSKLAENDLFVHEEILPEKIFLRSINQIWNIQYIDSPSPIKIISRPHQEMAIIGKIETQHHKDQCKKLLTHWVKKMAKIYLASQLNQISQVTQLSYEKLTIRDQKTRWGSCTRDKNISLNFRILFLPEHLASHILIHELCHTVHLNHSDKFWSLVAKFDPNWQEHRNVVRKTKDFIPSWVG